MWRTPLLLWVLGSAWFWGAAPLGIEDDLVTPGMQATLGLEDKLTTTEATETAHQSTSRTTLAPTEKRTKVPIEDLPTTESSDQTHKDNQTVTTPRVVTSHSVEKTSPPSKGNTTEDAKLEDKKGGLAVVALVGIVVGVLLAIVFIAVIIIVVTRKVSGRFSLSP